MMKYLLLKDVCSINMGQSPSSDSYNDDKEGIPFFQGNADFGDRYPVTRKWCSEPTKIAMPEDILISVRAPIGAINYAKEKCCIGRGLAAITPNNEKVSKEFIFWLLISNNNELNSNGTGRTFKAINRKVLEEILVPDIPLCEQLRCADILEKTYGIIQNKSLEILKLDELVKSRFIELFGDLYTNPFGWDIKNFPEFAQFDCNMTTDYDTYAEYPHIGIDCIEKDTGRILDYRTVKEDGVISGKYLFSSKHIIYSKIRPYLNKVALPDFDGVCSADAYPILPVEGITNRIYLANILRSEHYLEFVSHLSTRANMPKVNKTEISGYSAPIAPIELQNEFAEFVEKVDKSKFICQKKIQYYQELMDKKMIEYFR